jgi:LPXTG-motif cell wall-anchored protein
MERGGALLKGVLNCTDARVRVPHTVSGGKLANHTRLKMDTTTLLVIVLVVLLLGGGGFYYGRRRV